MTPPASASLDRASFQPRSLRGDHWALAGLALAAFAALAVRLGWPGLIDYKLDEGTIGQKALDVARGRHFHLDGVWSSRGVPTPPNMVYLLAVPFLFSDSPLVETAYVGLLSVVALGLTYWLAHRYFGAFAATAGALLYAFSPWPLHFARRAMPFSLLFLPVAIVAVSGALGFVEGRRRWQAAHIFALAFAVETHLSAVALGLLTLYLIAAHRARVDWRMVGAGAGLALLSTAPVWVVAARNYEVIAADLAEGGERTSETLLSPQVFDHIWANVTGARFYTLADPGAAPGEPPRADDLGPLLWIETAWLAAGLVGLALYAFRKRATPAGGAAGLLAAWTAAPALAFVAQWTAVYHHYFVPLMPAPYLVMAAGAVLGARRLRERGRLLGWGAYLLAGLLTLAVAAAHLATFARVMDYFAARFTPGDLGTPLGLKEQAARLAEVLAAENAAPEVLVVGEGDRVWGHETAAVFTVLLDRTPHRFVTGYEAAVFPARGALVLAAPGLWPALDWYEAHAAPLRTLPLREGEQPYRYYLAPHGFTLPRDFQPPAAGMDLANGARVIGFRWETPVTLDAPGRLLVAWQVGVAADVSSDYHFTLYLQDEAGRVWAQHDGRSFPSDMWRPGDIVVNWLFLPPPAEPPAGPVHLRLGMYAYPAILRVPVLGLDGAPASDAVLLETLALQP